MSAPVLPHDIENPQIRDNLDALMLAIKELRALIYVGSGNPNGAVLASPPAIYLNRAGGAATTLYVKESGANTNTGWVGK